MSQISGTRKVLGVALLAAGLGVGCAGVDEDAERDSQQAGLLGREPLVPTVTLTAQWRGGLCARVLLENPGAVAVTGWSASLALDGAKVTASWNALTTVSACELRAVARPYNAVIAPGGSADFGFCLSGVRGSPPAVLEASAQRLTDFGAGSLATLSLSSTWSTGYCAKVRVRNVSTERLWTWGAVVDLKGASVTHAWNAAVTFAGRRMTATPLPWNAVLAPEQATQFGFCATRAGPDWRPEIVSPGTSEPKRLTMAVYLPQRLLTCFIGDPCTPGAEGCIGLRDDANVLVEGFTEASLRAVRTTSPARATAAHEVCVELVMSPQERDAVVAELQAFAADAQRWTRGDVELELRLIDFESLDLDQSRWGPGVWIGPWDLAESALPRLDFLPDFNLVVPPIRDPVRQLHHDLGGCGGAFGANYGLRGAGWNWVPSTGSSFWFECANRSVFMHEWLHQVTWSYRELSGFTDLYGDVLPACGAGDPEPKRWFPDTHLAWSDPDFECCGLTSCAPELFYEHLLSEHWDPAVSFVANYCHDGRQDFDETGVDEGPSCSPGPTLEVAAAPSPALATPTP